MFKKILFTLLIIIISAYVKHLIDNHLGSNEEIVIHTTSGQIHGTNHQNYYSFKSIPYAQPPINELRFESPRPFHSNKNIDGTKKSPECLQWNHFNPNESNRVDGQEDCLYLNVYTPSISGDKSYPIIVFIHGGGFTFGNSYFLNHELLMEYGSVVMVSMNYRLGPLGFLSTQDNEISGNMGLKDQQLSLQWIKENARSFKGNPEQIILTGFSAGGASTHLQLLNEKTADLKLKSALAFSGTADCPWVIVPKPLERTKRLAELVQCPTDSTKNLKKCLKAKPAEEIVLTLKQFQPFMFFPFRIFGPVLESETVKDAFITESPNDLIKKGRTANIPFLTSYTPDEGAYNAADLMTEMQDGRIYLEEFLERFDELAPIAMYYGERMNNNETIKYTELLKEQYSLFNNDSLLEKYMRLQNIFSSELYQNSANQAIKLHRDYTSAPVYKYVYENAAPIGVGNLLSHRMDVNFGTCHGDDVFLIYNLPLRGEFRKDEEIISKKLIDMVQNFAINGKLVYGDLEVPANVPNSKKVTYLKITRERTSIVIEDD